MIMLQTAAVCAAIVIALAIARMTPARGQQGKFGSWAPARRR